MIPTLQDGRPRRAREEVRAQLVADMPANPDLGHLQAMRRAGVLLDEVVGALVAHHGARALGLRPEMEAWGPWPR